MARTKTVSTNQKSDSQKTSFLVPKKRVAPTPLQKIARLSIQRERTSIPKTAFMRFVKELVISNRDWEFRNDLRFHKEALLAIHFIAEEFLIRLFEDSNLCANHAKRITIDTRDIRLVLRLKRLY
ncbi:histone H3 [Entamoeba marina]